jgi:hypothetical protein
MSLFEIPEDPDYRKGLEFRIDARVHDLIETFGYDDIEASVGRWKIEHGGPIGSAPARHEDPRTSQAQGEKMADVRRFSDKSNSGRLLREFFVSGELGLTDHKATAIVVGEDAPVTRFEGCRRRCSDLRAAGFIEDSHREEDGRIVWTITASGSLAFANMRRTGYTRGGAKPVEDIEGLQ